MIALQAGMRVLVATKPVDFRSADSLGSFDQGSLMRVEGTGPVVLTSSGSVLLTMCEFLLRYRAAGR
jgi:hypothetical protein